MDTRKFGRTTRSPVPAKREHTPHDSETYRNRILKIERSCARSWNGSTLLRYWQGYALRGIYTVMHIIAETCLDQVYAGIDAKDLKFYQKCENGSEAIIWSLDEAMNAEIDDFSHYLAKCHKLYNPWVQSFLDKMKRLDTKVSWIAVARVRHAQDYYGKSFEKLSASATAPYVDADPARIPRPIYLDNNPNVPITSAFMAIRNILEKSPPRPTLRTCSPPTRATERARSPPTRATERARSPVRTMRRADLSRKLSDVVNRAIRLGNASDDEDF